MSDNEGFSLRQIIGTAVVLFLAGGALGYGLGVIITDSVRGAQAAQVVTQTVPEVITEVVTEVVTEVQYVDRVETVTEVQYVEVPVVEYVEVIPEGYLPPCEYEDSTGCYWDASERGNGVGNDFINP